MATPRIRFGVEMMGPFEGMNCPESARYLEDVGYSTMFAPDHFDEGYGPITAMATAAAATTTLNVATAVLCTDFRHPAVLARELASIDMLSGGRLEVGLGAGYQVNDYRTSGIAMNEPGTRVDRLMEYVTVLKGAFSANSFSFDGQHYHISELDGTPKPKTAGGPPIFIAGGGKRMLTYAAAHADIIGVNPTLASSLRRNPADGLPEGIDRKFEWIRSAAGERMPQIEFHAWLRHAGVVADPRADAAHLEPVFGADVENILNSPIVLLGSVDEIVDRLHERRERWGYSYYTLQQPAAREFEAVLSRLA